MSTRDECAPLRISKNTFYELENTFRKEECQDAGVGRSKRQAWRPVATPLRRERDSTLPPYFFVGVQNQRSMLDRNALGRGQGFFVRGQKC
jgi:hypothetical protein